MMNIDKMISAVQEGYLTATICGATGGAYPADFPFDGEGLTLLTALEAHDGSLDAAHRLHEALVPLWVAHVMVGGAAAGVTDWRCTLEHWDTGEEIEVVNMPNPARAWLLALFLALRAPLGGGSCDDSEGK